MSMSITAAPACASCVLGATNSALISFTYHKIETITVSVIPHVTVYTEGSSTSRTTNYVSITETQTDIVGGGSNRNASKTYTNFDELTWTVGDATLTYPTTYVDYLGFAGAAASSEDCASGAEATSISLPSTTERAPFIYPYTTGATALPVALVQYLGQLPEVMSQFSGVALTGCAGLDYTPAETSSSAPSSSSPIPSSKGNYTFTSTTKYGGPTRLTVPGVTLSEASTTHAYASPAPSAPAPYSSAPAASYATTNTHETAFIIQPITAQKPIVTTLPGGSDHHTGGGDHTTKTGGNKPPGYGDHTTKTGADKPTGNGHAPGEGDSTTKNGGYGDHGHQTGGNDNHNGATVAPADNTGKPSHVFHVGSSTITAKPHGAVTIGDHTLHHGETITIGSGPSASTIALEGKGNHEHLVVNGQTHRGHMVGAVVTPPAEMSSAIISQGGHKITAIYSSGSVVLQDGSKRTTVEGGSKVTFDGQTISVPHHGGTVKVNGEKVPMTGVASSQAVITAGVDTFTAIDSGSKVVLIEGSKTITLRDGAQTKFEGHTVSVEPSGSAVVVDGKTHSLSAAPTPEAIITAGGHTITALDMSGSVILEDSSSSTTVKDGRKVVFEGQTIKVPKHGSGIVVNGKTVQFSTSTPTSSSSTSSTTGVGGYIKGGLGGNETPSPTSTVSPADTNAASSTGLAAAGAIWTALMTSVGLFMMLL